MRYQSFPNARVTAGKAQIESLETRQLLSATVTGTIAAQNLTPGQTSAAINLASYFRDPTVTGTAVEIRTPVGNIPLVLTNSQTPKTVANFDKYITSGEYANSIIHRSVPGFVLQGGGFTTSDVALHTFAPIPNEFHEANTIGTIAMGLGSGPNSATSQWFINLANNSSSLDTTADGGPYTAFGNVVYKGMSVVNAIASLPIVNDSAQNIAWNTLPVRSGTNGATVTTEKSGNLLTMNPIIIPGGLTYTAASSNSTVVTAKVSATGGLTLVAGSAGGTATITLTATDMGGEVVTEKFSVNVKAPSSGVTIGVNAAKAATFTGTNGAVVVVTFTGGGDAALVFTGSNIKQSTTGNVTTITGTSLAISTITTTGSTSTSVLSITEYGGSGPLNVGSVTGGALESIVASNVVFNSVTLASATGGSISAASIGTIDITGAISDGLSLTSTGQSFSTFTAGSITGGTWSVAGSATSVTAGSASGWSADFAAGLGSLTVNGNFSGSITAPSIGTVTIDGAVNGSLFHLTGTGADLGIFTASGVFSSSIIDAAGSIGPVSVEGIVNSEIFAGSPPALP